MAVIMIMVHEWQTDVMIELGLGLYIDGRVCEPAEACMSDNRCER